MWINSPLGKWEQEARVDKAQQDAERMRMQEKAKDADGAARSGSLLNAASVGVHRLAAAAERAADVIRAWLAAPAAQRD